MAVHITVSLFLYMSGTLANSVAPDETPHYAASQRLIWGFPVSSNNNNL